MKVYHGSLKSGLKKLESDPSFARFKVENLVEGEGVYLTEDLEVAKGYASGGSIYEVEIESNNILDARYDKDFIQILEDTSGNFNLQFNISSINYVYATIESIISGNSSISDFGNSIRLILDNDEITMMYFEENGGYEMTNDIAKFIQDKINGFDGFRYLDQGINQGQSIIYVIKNSSVLSIKKEIKI
jgi:hypothetical protein